MEKHQEAKRIKIKVTYEFELMIYVDDEPSTEEEILNLAKEDFYACVHDETIVQNLKFEILEKG